MAIEPVTLAVLLNAAKAVGSVLTQAVPLVQSIRSGMMAKNDQAKQALAEQLQKLQDNLRKAGELAQVAEVYSRSLEDVVRLLGLCQNAEQFLKDNLDEFANPTKPFYSSNWRLLEMMMRMISANSEVPRRVYLGIERWYGEGDRRQLTTVVNDFTTAYEKASENLRHKLVIDVERNLAQMIERLQQTETTLRSTLYEGILTALQGVRGA